MSDDEIITLPEDLGAPTRQPNANPASPPSAVQALPATVHAIPATSNFRLGFSAAKVLTVDAFERSFVSWALREAEGNVSRAARRAGKERRSFARLLKKHGIRRAEFAVSD